MVADQSRAPSRYSSSGRELIISLIIVLGLIGAYSRLPLTLVRCSTRCSISIL